MFDITGVTFVNAWTAANPFALVFAYRCMMVADGRKEGNERKGDGGELVRGRLWLKVS